VSPGSAGMDMRDVMSALTLLGRASIRRDRHLDPLGHSRTMRDREDLC